MYIEYDKKLHLTLLYYEDRLFKRYDNTYLRITHHGNILVINKDDHQIIMQGVLPVFYVK